jgi:beta-lactamase regulating signal transducer with metallopeptidase domain
MSLLNQSAFLKALGWSLLDSLWQIGVLWLVYVCLTANGKKFQSRQRHTIALLSLAGGSLWFIVTLVINFYKAAASPESILVYGNGTEVLSPSLSFINQAIAFCEPALSFLSVAYLLVIMLLFVRFYGHYRHTQRLFTQGLQKVPPEWRVFLQQACAHMSIKKTVRIWFSSLVDTPLTLGFWKPVILLPIAAVNQLSIQQAEAILLHELNHIRRNDYLVNLLIACADIILFFNPFVRLLTAAIRKERENSCDDLVLQFRYDARSYAEALLLLEQQRLAVSPALTVAATGKSKQLLLNRVKRILTNEPVTTPLNQKFIAYLFSILLIGFIGWYNPGKVIIKTIAEVTLPPVATTETPFSFNTEAITTIDDPDEEASPAPENETPAQKEVTGNNHEEPANPPYNELKEFIEEVTDARLAEVSSSFEAIPAQLASFAGTLESVDFSLPANETSPADENSSPERYPYIPNSSFSYQVVEDTTLPKKYIMTVTDQKAKASMDLALAALKEIDWKKLGKELQAAGKEINVEQLQNEIKKAMKEVDWKKIQDESQQALAQADEEFAKQQGLFRVQLGNYQHERSRQQQKLKLAQDQILKDRIEQHQKLKKLETEKKDCIQTKAKTKKIVHI